MSMLSTKEIVTILRGISKLNPTWQIYRGDKRLCTNCCGVVGVNCNCQPAPKPDNWQDATKGEA